MAASRVERSRGPWTLGVRRHIRRRSLGQTRLPTAQATQNGNLSTERIGNPIPIPLCFLCYLLFKFSSFASVTSILLASRPSVGDRNHNLLWYFALPCPAGCV